MPKTLIVTTGTSMFTSSRCWKGCEAFGPLQIDDCSEDLLWSDNPEALQHLRRIREEVFGKIPSPADLKTINDAAAKVVESQFREECWAQDRLHLLSAELATLYLILQDPDNTYSDIRFLCGTSNLQDAYLNAAILRKMIPGIGVEVGTVGDWDPIDDAAFGKVIGQLSKVMDEMVAGHQTETHVDFVLTGGYKILSIYIAIVFGMGRDWGRSIDRLWYLSEGENRKLVYLGRRANAGASSLGAVAHRVA